MPKLTKRVVDAIAELCDQYLEHHALPHKKPSSIAGDRQIIRNYILPALGRRKVADVTRSDVQKLHLCEDAG